jgi:YD repeat-containing protein
LWKDYKVFLGVLDNTVLGGWNLNIHHSYHAGTQTLYLGNGDKRSATDPGVIVINTVAGTAGGAGSFTGDGGQATQARLSQPQSVAVGPDGSLYIADTSNRRIRRVGTDGIITTVAGTGGVGSTGDGGLATQAQFVPGSIAVGSDGSLYIADTLGNRVRRVRPDGIIVTVAGSGGPSTFSGDGGPAIQAQFFPQSIALGPDGSLYIADVTNRRVRHVGADGIINTVAGTGSPGFSGDGGLATNAQLTPQGVAVGADGSLYIADINKRIRKVGTDGIITTVAGTGAFGFGGDGGLAIQAQFSPDDITLGADGSLYIADTTAHNIRRVGPEGIITTVAGTSGTGFAGDGGPATLALLNFPGGIAIKPDGSLVIADTNNNRIRQLSPSLPGFNIGDISIAAEDGSELYIFNSAGRHLRTLDALTDATRYQFAYNTAGNLATITDGDGKVTTIERDGSGNPTAIVAPFGQSTALTLNADGYLSKITNPAGEAVQLTYNTGDAAGLLATMTDPRGNIHRYFYDTLGRLIRDEDPAGGVKTLTRTDITDFHYSVAVKTALGQVDTYEVDDLPTGDMRRVQTKPDGTRTETLYGADGSRKTTFADGSVVNLLKGPDPRWSMQAPVSKGLSTTKGGLTSTVSTDRQTELVDANNPLSMIRQTDTVTVNGRIFKSVFDKATQTTTNTSPLGRTSTAVIDSLGRITQAQVSGFLAVKGVYDVNGRLSRIGQGTGADERVVDFAYNPQGYLASVSDPLGRNLGIEYDTAGRIIRKTQPDGQSILYDYDADGNLASLTPPGRPAHIFHYTPVNLIQDYQPPAVNVSNNTVYEYDLDKHLTKITRPDAQTLNYTYDSAGRLSILDIPRVNKLRL